MFEFPRLFSRLLCLRRQRGIRAEFGESERCIACFGRRQSKSTVVAVLLKTCCLCRIPTHAAAGVRAQHSQGDRQRQRHGTNQLRSLALGHWSSRLALHRARQAGAECLHRELQQQTSRRMPQRARLPHARRGARNDRGMESRLQSHVTARQSRRLDADRVPDAKKTGNATTRRGPNNRRTLLMIGGELGSRPQTPVRLSAARKSLLSGRTDGH